MKEREVYHLGKTEVTSISKAVRRLKTSSITVKSVLAYYTCLAV